MNGTCTVWMVQSHTQTPYGGVGSGTVGGEGGSEGGSEGGIVIGACKRNWGR